MKNKIEFTKANKDSFDGSTADIHSIDDRLVFLKEEIDKTPIKQNYFLIGVDTYDKNYPCYCLVRVVDEVSEVLLCKTKKDEKQFKEEVENLARYFNAEIIKEL